MSGPTGRPVVAGVDFSENSRLAAGAAAWEAGWREVPLRLVYGTPQPVCLGPHTFPAEVSRTFLDEARHELEKLAAKLQGDHPTLSVETALVDEPSATALIEQSHDSSLLVVGAQGQTANPEPPVGSIAGQVAAHAHCPVIVVNRGDDQRATAAAVGPVVAGMDDSSTATEVLAFALAEAAARSRELLLVHADDTARLTDRDRTGPVRTSPTSDPPVAGALREQLDRYPQVTVRQEEVHGNPAEVLMNISRETDASLVVVGSRGHSGILGMLRRSVDRRLINDADQPVAVVHHPRG